MFDKLIDLIAQWIKLFQFFQIIHSYQMAIRLRFGVFSKVIAPGLHFYLPFHIDDILSANVVTKTIQTKPQSLITKDGQFVTISLIVTFHVDDIKTYILDVENANHVIEDASYGLTADFVMKHTWEELVEMENTNNELTKFIRRRAGKFGIYIDAVQVMDFIKCPALRMIGIKNEQTTQHN